MPSLTPGQALYHARFTDNPVFLKMCEENNWYQRAGSGGKFHLDLMQKYPMGINGNQFASRRGEWSTVSPIEIMPIMRMPEYDPDFKKTFSEVSDQRALDIRKILNDDPGKEIVVYFSGGMDSMVIMVSLLKNLTSEELSRIRVGCSMHSILEAPAFFENHIRGKFKTVDLTRGNIRYSDITSQGNYAITGDNGDNLFGTELGTQLYFEYERVAKNLKGTSLSKLNNLLSNVKSVTNPDVHFSNFADIIIEFYSLPDRPSFGRLYYEKILKNINTCGVPIHSLHDFYWWGIFNQKWMSCAVRGPMLFGDAVNFDDSFNKYVINWYVAEDYQKWSMANNNNGEKITGTTALTYKWAARKYIYEYTKDSWYFNFKLKIGSLAVLTPQKDMKIAAHKLLRFGIDKNYDLVLLTDPGVKDYIEHHLTTCQIDW